MGTQRPRQRVRNFTSIAHHEAAKTGLPAFPQFEGKGIRRTFHEGEWHFAVADVAVVLTDTPNPSDYLKKLRLRDGELAKGWGQLVTPLSVQTSGGPQKLNCATMKAVFRIVQSIPSPKAEPFKLWLAAIAHERIQEMADPSLAIDRAIGNYKALGRPKDWIELRLQSLSARNELTDEWKTRDVKPGSFPRITNAMSEEALGLPRKEHLALKGLPETANIREAMTGPELVITTLSEQAGVEIMRARGTIGYAESAKASIDCAKVATVTRKALEEQIGKPIVTEHNVQLPST